jgi:hypothetical protein
VTEIDAWIGTASPKGAATIKNREGVSNFPMIDMWLLAPSIEGTQHQYAFEKFGAGEGIRTLDPNLGKVVLYH